MLCKLKIIFILNTMNYLEISDGLWYAGHILSGFAVIVNHYSYPYAVVLIFTGQFITIISRPIGRIKIEQNINIKV